MKLSTTLALSALYATTAALAGPVLEPRKHKDSASSMDEGLLASPSNDTQIASGGTLDFMYKTNASDVTSLRVALVHMTEIAMDISVTNHTASQNISLPSDLAAGTYFLAIAENIAGSHGDYNYTFANPGNSTEKYVYVMIGNSTMSNSTMA